jgi:anaerobic selenocysteine-containing dehydrogenase
LNFETATDIRNEIQNVIPLYDGIGDLRKETDSFQYGGARILNDGICHNLPDKKARFSVVVPQNDLLKEGEFYLTTRRGKQFNSIVYGDRDPLIGSKSRDEIYLSREDAGTMKIADGDKILLRSDAGEYAGICKIAPVHPRTIQVFWPEGNVLLARRIDPGSHEPDYNVVVRVEKK